MEDVIQTTEYDQFSTEEDDSLHIASKCWERVIDAANKAGYREGIQDGSDSVLQEGFDIGYKDGFKTAFALGKYKSMAIAVSPTLKHPAHIASILDKTRRGACWICNMESQDKTPNVIENIKFSELLNKQREHSTEVTNQLHEYFEPILKKSGIEVHLNL